MLFEILGTTPPTKSTRAAVGSSILSTTQKGRPGEEGDHSEIKLRSGLPHTSRRGEGGCSISSNPFSYWHPFLVSSGAQKGAFLVCNFAFAKSTVIGEKSMPRLTEHPHDTSALCRRRPAGECVLRKSSPSRLTTNRCRRGRPPFRSVPDVVMHGSGRYDVMYDRK